LAELFRDSGKELSFMIPNILGAHKVKNDIYQFLKKCSCSLGARETDKEATSFTRLTL
jgi:hypothetical protein